MSGACRRTRSPIIAAIFNCWRRTVRRATLDDWDALDTAQVRTFVASLHQRGLSGRSIARTLSAVRSFYRYLLREGLARRNPAAGVTAPKAPKRLPQTLTTDQAARLVDFKSDHRS